MNEMYDPLEAELSALRPREVSPALTRRVAERLADSKTPERHWSLGIALTGGLAAACLAALLLWSTSDRSIEPRPTGIQPPAPLIANGDTEPTLQVYRRVLARSPQELNALLDKHAAITLPPDPELERVRMRAFIRSDELYSTNGEL